MMTLVGTLIEALSDDKVTVVSVADAVVKVTVPLTAEPDSITDPASSVTDNVDTSASVTSTVLSAVPRSEVAVMVTFWVPSTTPSITPPTVMVAVVDPARIVTSPATLASPVSLDDNVTTVSTSRATLKPTVKSTVDPSATVAVVGVIDNTASSTSVTKIESLTVAPESEAVTSTD